jgi:serine/threonine-protein kinase
MVSLGPNKDTVIVPNVAGMAFDDAKQVLENMGLSVVRQDTVSEERAENVISMNVAAGEEVAEGTVITLQVSTGVSRPGMKTVRITFSIPEDAVGSYHIILNDSGVAAAVSSSFDPQIAAGVAALTVEGTQEADLTAVLVNDTTGAEATIGVYHVNFEAGTSEMVSGSISEAFSAVANET